MRNGRAASISIGLILLLAAPVFGGEQSDGKTVLQRLDPEWGGHFRIRGRHSKVDESNVLALLHDDRLLDGGAELRVKNVLTLGENVSLETHYEAVTLLGDTIEAYNRVASASRLPGGLLEDDTRLFDLTSIADDGDRHRIYQRVDRLALTYKPSWGAVVAGRQALTWGNGLLFNPMDLFNPFSPTDVERDYKIGDDMLNVTVLTGRGMEIQAVAVPRRDRSTRDLDWDSSSVGTRIHSMAGELEFDVMAARHYEDMVGGLGVSGYLGSAAWRVDTTYTVLNDDRRHSGYLSMVANIDRSWVWAGHNWYGFVEAYFNGLGYDEAWSAMTDSTLMERFNSGELFTTGRTYLSGTVQYEAHPLLNVYLTTINNLGDRSGMALMRLVWDPAEDFQVVAGADLPCGGSNTEFGGVIAPAASTYVWVTRFF